MMSVSRGIWINRKGFPRSASLFDYFKSSQAHCSVLSPSCSSSTVSAIVGLRKRHLDDDHCEDVITIV